MSRVLALVLKKFTAHLFVNEHRLFPHKLPSTINKELPYSENDWKTFFAKIYDKELFSFLTKKYILLFSDMMISNK